MVDDSRLGLPGSPWIERALVFNTQPALYLHASWLDVLPHAELARRLRGSPRASAALSRYLLGQFALEGRYAEDFSSPWARLALLDAPWLEWLMRRLGLALQSPRLRRELSGARLTQLKDALSEEDWRFVMREAPLLGRIPDFRSAPIGRDPGLQLVAIGVRFCALRGLAAEGHPLLGRLALKLPSLCASALRLDQGVGAAEFPMLLRKLIRELPPEWHPLYV